MKATKNGLGRAVQKSAAGEYELVIPGLLLPSSMQTAALQEAQKVIPA